MLTLDPSLHTLSPHTSMDNICPPLDVTVGVSLSVCDSLFFVVSQRTIHRKRMMRLELLVFLLSAASVAVVSAMTTKIEPGSNECVKELVPGRTVVNVAYAVTHGGKLDLNVRITAHYIEKPSDTKRMKILGDWKLSTEGHAEFIAPPTTEPSMVEVCFDNTMSRWTPKWVNFEFYKMLPSTDESVASTSDNDSQQSKEYRDLEDRLAEHSRMVYDMRIQMQKVRTMEEEHRNTVVSANNWLYYGAFVNGTLLAVMAVFQFWYLKSFLAVRSSVMRM